MPPPVENGGYSDRLLGLQSTDAGTPDIAPVDAGEPTDDAGTPAVDVSMVQPMGADASAQENIEDAPRAPATAGYPFGIPESLPELPTYDLIDLTSDFLQMSSAVGSGVEAAANWIHDNPEKAAGLVAGLAAGAITFGAVAPALIGYGLSAAEASVAAGGIAGATSYYTERFVSSQEPSAAGLALSVATGMAAGYGVGLAGDPVQAVARAAEQQFTVERLRTQYVGAVRGLERVAEAMRSAGSTTEQVARTVHGMRNVFKVLFRRISPSDAVRLAEERCLQVYGNRLGPTIEQLRAEGKTWEQIIESAARPGGADLGL